ncbi:MAG: L,D-transpeptidase family protein [Blastocatellia bacterium]
MALKLQISQGMSDIHLKRRMCGLCVTLVMGVAAAVLPPDVYGLGQKAPRRAISSKKITRAMILEAQQRLTDLGYWTREADGKWGEASRFGLLAFQKVEGRPRTGKLTFDELRALRSAARPVPRQRDFAHIEVDLHRQVLFVVEANGEVSRILPVSTGSGKPFEIEGEIEPAITPVGRFRIYRKVPGWRKSKLGLLYYPNYLVGGIAIHGNPAVPSQPASHGCIRIPMFASEEFSGLTPIGTEVIVYNSSPNALGSVSR